MGTVSSGYGNQEISWSAIFKLENQESQWCNGLRTRSFDVQRQEQMDISAQKERESSFFLCCSALFRPSIDWMMPSHIGEGGASLFSLLVQILISSKDTDTSRSSVLPAISASPSSIKLTHKLNHLLWSKYYGQETMFNAMKTLRDIFIPGGMGKREEENQIVTYLKY